MSMTTALTLMLAFAPAADEVVPVPGSTATFPAYAAAQDNGNPVQMKLTGVALRKKLIINVYAMGSYIDARVPAKSGEQVAAADATKWLFLVMERTVSGADMANAISTAVKANSPQGFDREIGQVVAFFEKQEAKKGDRIWIAHQPGKGMLINVAGRAQVEIPNVEFAKAVWGIYLGASPISESVKHGLSSRLR